MGYILPGAVGILLLAAAISDLRSRTISNYLNLAIAFAALPLWWLSDLALWPEIALQVAVAIGVFLLFFALFVVGAMGGGDVKMIAAAVLWVPLPLILPMLTIMAITGGLLSAMMLIAAKLSKNNVQIEVPYGVAIAAAGLWVLYEQYFNHLPLNPMS